MASRALVEPHRASIVVVAAAAAPVATYASYAIPSPQELCKPPPSAEIGCRLIITATH